jgi:hypothetical protein
MISCDVCNESPAIIKMFGMNLCFRCSKQKVKEAIKTVENRERV